MPVTMKKSLWSWAAIAAACLLAGAGIYAYAGKQPSGANAAATEPENGEAAGDEPDPKSLAKPIPKGDVDELLEFISDCQTQAKRAMRKSDEKEVLAQLWTISAAADKVLGEKLELKQRAIAASSKMQALSTLAKFRQRQAIKELKKFAGELAQDEQADFAAAGRSALLNADLLQVMTSENEDITAADAKLLSASIMAHLLAKGQPDLELVQQALHYIELSDAPTLAAGPYKKLADVVEDLVGEEAADQIAAFRKSAERVMLVGKPIEISGTLVDGTELDWSKFKGKVVLVDFWATWCGPCVKEIPNVIQNYKRYHDHGFEVVGISADEDRQELETFLEENEVPWPILFSDPDGSEKSHPMIEKYGVSSFPTLMLLGKDGKLIGFNARGEQLGRQLARLLGPVPELDEQESAGGDKSAGGE